MKQLALLSLLVTAWRCDSTSETVSQGREAVKELVTQPFNTLNSAKDSLQKNEEKQKTALEEADKENK